MSSKRTAFAAALLALALPVGASAKDKPKVDSNGVELWPPAPTDETEPKPAPKPTPPPDAGPPRYQPDPDLDEPPPPPKPRVDVPEDVCQSPFEDCREDCTIEHGNDDSKDKAGRKPLMKCLRHCQESLDNCHERKQLGLHEHGRDE
jgi:hypothetical protein